MKKMYFPYKVKTGTAFALLILLILPIYFNSFHASWQFDDKPNILDNTRIHLTDLSPASLRNTLFALPYSGSFYRPLPMLSFALNWYIGKEDPLGYHIFNIFMHLLTAFILFLVNCNLLQTPNAINHFKKESIYFISLLSAALWAINPIQIQAVTYIVQRMAAMSAMFYLLGIYFYIKGRLATTVKIQMLFYVACCFSFLFALLSKENAAMLLASLVLVEIVFFQDLTSFKKIRVGLPVLTGTGIAIILLGIVINEKGDFNFLFSGYALRPFTLVERLLTEPRIVLFYISQILYPLPARLSITHDIIISKSLLDPWTTLPAILSILFLIGIGVSQIKKKPILAFSILFFFLNHIIESTILPLELIFEHRNYLPSFFLFLPIAAGLKTLLDFYKTKNRPLYVFIAAFVTLVVIGLGCFTYTRNRDWRTETTLWHDAMKKSPQDTRPPWNLAIEIAWDKNVQPLQLEVALVLFEKALSLKNYASKNFKAPILRNMGLIYYTRGEYEKAVEIYNKGIEIDPYFRKIRYDLISSLIMEGKWKEALEQLDRVAALKKNNIEPDYFKLKGFILLWQKKPEEALIYFREALKLEPNNKAVLLNTGVALSLMGKHKNAELFLKRAVKFSPGDIRAVYALIENSVRAGNMQKAEKYIEQLFVQFSVQKIIYDLDVFSEDYQTAPMSSELIIPVVKQKIMQLSDEIKKLNFSPNIE